MANRPIAQIIKDHILHQNFQFFIINVRKSRILCFSYPHNGNSLSPLSPLNIKIKLYTCFFAAPIEDTLEHLDFQPAKACNCLKK